MEAALWETVVVGLYLLTVVVITARLLDRKGAPPGGSATVSAILSAMAERSSWFASIWRKTERWRAPVGRRLPAWADDLGVVVGLSVLLMALGVAGEVVEDVLTDDTGTDTWIADALGTRSYATLTRVAEVVSMASSPRATAFVAVCVLGFLVWRHRRIEAIGLFLSVGGTALWTMVLKEIIGRTRPAGVEIYHPHGMAFPSGHTTSTLALYLFLAWLVARRQTGWAGTWPWAMAAAITTVVGASRVYLAVHWVTDVVGGAALATAWVLLCLLWTRTLLERRMSPSGLLHGYRKE